MIKKIAVLTSGGDAPGMNAAIRAVVRCGMTRGMEVYGVNYGYEGLIDDDIFKMEWKDSGDIIFRGGTILRTARSKRFLSDEWIDKAADNLKARGIEGIVIAGGDGSFNGGLQLAKRGIKVVGVPATIDNDLSYTDFTIGFATAVDNVLDLISKVRDTSSSHSRNTIIEVMGRHCGDLALYAGLAGGADAILLPEVHIDISELVEAVRDGSSQGKQHNVIIKAEGVDIPLDELEQLLESLTGHETRSVVPGYMQRGGSPSVDDRLLASQTCDAAVKLLAEGAFPPCNAFATGIRHGAIISMPLDEALAEPRRFRRDLYLLSKTLG